MNNHLAKIVDMISYCQILSWNGKDISIMTKIVDLNHI
jgi:hypothetical protein